MTVHGRGQRPCETRAEPDARARVRRTASGETEHTRAYAGGTLENQSTDVFSFPSQRPQVFSPVNFGDVDVTDALFAKVRIFTHTAIQPAVRFSRIARHPRARRRPNRAKLGKHVTSLFPRVP